MQSVHLSSGTIHYRDSGGAGPVLLFVHGALVNGELWTEVADKLGPRARCIIPDWPLGSHREPMHSGADLSPLGVARLIAEFALRLDLEAFTLVGNNSGGALCQLVAAHHDLPLAGLVLTNCDALEVFPPRAYAYLKWIARSPAAMSATTRLLHRWPFLTRAPFAFGSLTRRRIPETLLGSWLEPAARDPRVRRDAGQFIGSIDKTLTLRAAERLRSFARPVLLVWGESDPFFTVALAERLAAVFPEARLVPVPNARTFVSLDQPTQVAEEIAGFLATGALRPREAPHALAVGLSAASA